jgi:hypothetical protein
MSHFGVDHTEEDAKHSTAPFFSNNVEPKPLSKIFKFEGPAEKYEELKTFLKRIESLIDSSEIHQKPILYFKVSADDKTQEITISDLPHALPGQGLEQCYEDLLDQKPHLPLWMQEVIDEIELPELDTDPSP